MQPRRARAGGARARRECAFPMHRRPRRVIDLGSARSLSASSRVFFALGRGCTYWLVLIARPRYVKASIHHCIDGDNYS